MSHFPKLFEPARIGKIRLKNRIVMLPMGSAYASACGEVSQKTLDYYAERAKGGVGMITVGGSSPFGRRDGNRLLIDADWYMAGHYEMVEAIHAEGVAVSIQLNHPGRQWHTGDLAGRQPVSASDVQCFRLGEIPYTKPRPLAKEEMGPIMDKWAEAALRAKKVGYDMIELHAAHGYLIQQFMSPYTNRRTDEYGGSLENRMRFPLELLERVRKAVGADFPIGFRLSSEEFIPGGITIKDSPAIARILADAGAAYICLSCGTYDTANTFNDTTRDVEGWKSDTWEPITRAVDIPVIAGGGLRNPAYCESLLVEGKADLVGLARPLLADPQWPNKARDGRVEDICPCVSCLECLYGSARRRQGGGARRCTVNPATGREREFCELKPAAVKKKVMVVGGGPGGLEAARIAALRGHDVTLYDKGSELGGALLLASAPPGKARLDAFRDYLKSQLDKAGVKVKLRTEVTPRRVQSERPEAVIVATGSTSLRPMSCDGAVSAWDVLSGKAKINNKRVVIVGGGMVGLETAEYLAQRDNQVTVVEMLPKMAADMEMHNRFVLLQALQAAGVRMLTEKKAVEVVKGGLSVADAKSGEKSFIEADVVVLALGAAPNRDLADALEGKAPELYTIGDCNQPRIIMEAVYEGSRVGRRI